MVYEQVSEGRLDERGEQETRGMGEGSCTRARSCESSSIFFCFLVQISDETKRKYSIT